jgi:hypothetical protein
MREVDRVLARGRGRWGANLYDLELVINIATRTDSTGRHSQSITSFDLLIGDPAGGRRTFQSDDQRAEYWQQMTAGTWIDELPRDPGDGDSDAGLTGLVAGEALIRRSFATESQRAKFIEKWMQDLALNWLDEPEERERRHPLASIIGEDLVSVSFVRDWAQLHFGGPPLNLYVWPRLHHGSTLLQRKDSGYADTLISLINARVTAVDELLDLGLALDFDTDVRLTIPLDGTDATGPEIAEFAGPDGHMVWRPGDEPIDWIRPPS